jgi:hypothetical protein
MDPDAANNDVTVKQQTKAASLAGMKKTLTAAIG